jgi:hypothetical protein
MAVVFGDGTEPWSVARGGVKRWLHCRAETIELPEEHYAELATLLAAHGIDAMPQVLLVTRDDAGIHRLHAAGAAADVALAELPTWLQRPEQAPGPVPKPRTRRPGTSRTAA